MISANWPPSRGITSRTHAVRATRALRLRPPTRGSAGRPGIMLRSVGTIRLNRSGTPIRSVRMKYPSSLSEGISC